MKKILNKTETKEVLGRLIRDYPDAGPELHFKNNFELLVATILSAQTTDKQVNKVTDKMFVKYPTPNDYILLTEKQIEENIRSIGFFRMKAKNIKKTCKILVDTYDGEVPSSFEELIKLPGVGRKTANVVLSNAFNVPRIAVDTHVFRVSNRIGIVKAKDVLQTEEKLMKKIDKDMWSKAHHLFIFHGRRVCKARKPDCENCSIKDLCLYYGGN